jgi:PKD repeat protein
MGIQQMRSRPLVAASVLACAAVLLSGCTGKYRSDFSLVVVNRTANLIQTMANGRDLGQVASGQSVTFTLDLPQSNANVFTNGVAPTAQATVVLTAKDVRTGVLSAERPTTLSQGSPTYVSFSADDFPSTGPTIARFTFSPTTATINQDVSFNGTSSTVNNGTYDWDFGDGQTGTGPTITKRYARAGTFTVTLIVTSDTKVTSSASRTITVSGTVTAPNFNFTPAAPAINQPVVFTVVTAPGPGAGVGGTYSWDFGDRTTGTGSPATHVFTQGGNYTVTLRFTNDAGLSATTARQITVSSTLPANAASFVFSPTNPRVNDDVFFNASASTVANASAYTWDWGDGTTGSGVTTSHRYSIKRAFTVVLTVTNAFGQTAVTNRVVTLADP